MLFRLADYLDQYGRKVRAEEMPPTGFWMAAAEYLTPSDQSALGRAAQDRGLYRDAAQLHKNAALAGSSVSAIYFAQPPECLAGDPRPTRWAVTHVSFADLNGAGARPMSKPAQGGCA